MLSRFLLISEDYCRDMVERDGKRPLVASYVSRYDSCYLRQIQDF